MDTRRDFIKKAALLAGTAGVWGGLPASIQAAFAIDPAEGSTYLDAEYVVILMQENRSFDHCFGTLKGVRGYNDPRAIKLPGGNPVWLQTNTAGETYAPFRLDIKGTKSTWMGSLPHGWTDQVDARNGGKYNRWLDVKAAGHKDYRKMPLTLGFYNREDIPFYYALADAFTVCDQHFCSSLTGTTPNRLYLWTGTVREKHSADVFANVRNSEVDYGREASWTTFPERLEDLGISWKIYQNEISLDSGFQGEEDAWLSNFTDNPIEWFTQYNVRFATGYRNNLDKQIKALRAETSLTDEKKKRLADLEAEQAKWSQANFDKLDAHAKNIHNKAFTHNAGDPDYRSLTTLTYRDGETERQVQVPKGDVLHQFRQDVQSGKLPTVSWIVAPENFSDHPGAAWYGSWYLSEVMEILTKNPEVWKKTIFLVTYDENDGYFDHFPPFVPPHPTKPESGLVSKGIDTSVEYVMLEQDAKRNSPNSARESSIGLGYRVPLLIVSPWSRGGYVCSEVFDHTSSLQFLEGFLSHKTGKKVEETNITAWRRTICGDLTSAFRPYKGEKLPLPEFLDRDEFVEEIHKAKFKGLPSGYKSLTPTDITEIRRDPKASPLLSKQEKGTRPSNALPYQLLVNGALQPDKTRFAISFEAQNKVFGKRAVGSPFNVYALLPSGDIKVRNYAVAAGDRLTDTWALSDFEGGDYHLRVDGPNGFFREFKGNASDPALDVTVDYQRGIPGEPHLTGNIDLTFTFSGSDKPTFEIYDNVRKKLIVEFSPNPSGKKTFTIETKASSGWYDFSVVIRGKATFEKRFAGRVETGKDSISDPAMA